jgi:AcrR family transcriptional regulator
MVWSAIEPSETGQDPDARAPDMGTDVDRDRVPRHGHSHGQPPGQAAQSRQPGRSGHAAPAGPAGHGAHAGDQTRARILDVALELIADRGFAATSTREIAEHLGFTKAALYYHFRTKDDLLAAIVGTAMADFEALIERGEGARTADRRRDLVEGYVQMVETHADLIRVLASDPSVKESPGLHDAMPMFRTLVRLLAGTDDPDTAQRTRVRAALTAIHGALVYAQPGDDPEVARATALEAACAVLGLPGSPPAASRSTGSQTTGPRSTGPQTTGPEDQPR